MEKVIFILIAGLILSSCSSEASWEQKVKQRINQVNKDAEITEIDLDQIKKVELEPDIIVKPDTSGGYKIGVPEDVIAFNDSLYMLDKTQSSIIVLDGKGKIMRRVDKEGRGPGEITEPNSMATNGEFIFVYDAGNARLHMYDQQFEILSSVTATPDAFSRSISSADSVLYIVDKMRTHASEYLVKQYSIYPELQENRSFHPRLLPRGEQPAVINNVELYANSLGYLAVGYRPLPRLFIYEPKGELMHSLIFSGSPVEKVKEFNEEIEQKHRQNPDRALGRAPFIYAVLLDNHLNIYLFTLNKSLYVFSLKNNSYELAGSYILEHPDGTGRKENITISEGRLFLQYHNFPDDILVYQLTNFF